MEALYGYILLKKHVQNQSMRIKKAWMVNHDTFVVPLIKLKNGKYLLFAAEEGTKEISKKEAKRIRKRKVF